MLSCHATARTLIYGRDCSQKYPFLTLFPEPFSHDISEQVKIISSNKFLKCVKKILGGQGKRMFWESLCW